MEKPIFFRRCHVCGSTNQSLGERVYTCQHCGQSFIPFFYFDERFTPVMDEAILRSSNTSDKNNYKYTPIQGLTAYWDTM